MTGCFRACPVVTRAQPWAVAGALATVGAAPTPAWPPRCARGRQRSRMPWPPGTPADDYDNFEETPSPASAVLPSASYRRLEKIKAAYDPAR